MTARTPKNIVFKTVDKKRQKENFLHPLESYYWYFEAYKEKLCDELHLQKVCNCGVSRFKEISQIDLF